MRTSWCEKLPVVSGQRRPLGRCFRMGLGVTSDSSADSVDNGKRIRATRRRAFAIAVIKATRVQSRSRVLTIRE